MFKFEAKVEGNEFVLNSTVELTEENEDYVIALFMQLHDMIDDKIFDMPVDEKTLVGESIDIEFGIDELDEFYVSENISEWPASRQIMLITAIELDLQNLGIMPVYSE